MFTKQYYENYTVGHVRETGGRTVTEADIIIHAGQTGDFFPHHMDAEWCKTQPFGQRIVHGTLVFGIAIGLTATVVNEVAMTYGYDRLRFMKPVFIGDTIRVKVSITQKKDHKKPGFGIVTELVEATNQHGEMVMSCEHLLFSEKKQVDE